MAKDNTAAKVLEVARGEIGTSSGGKYIDYYNQITGLALPRGAAWCASWVTWVMRHAGVPVDSVLNYKGCATASEWFAARGRFMPRSSGYVPKPGDIIMYEWNPQNEGTAYDDGDDHTGIVEKFENGIVHTIEGNNGGTCRRDWWSLGNPCISGYCVPLYNMEKEDDKVTYEEFKAHQERYEKEKAAKAAAAWAGPALGYCKEHEIMVGDAEGGMRPFSPIARQEAAQMFYNCFCRYKTIDDVPGWGKDTVQRMTDLGIVAGYGRDEQGRVILNMSEIELRALCWLERYVGTIEA